MAEAPHGAKPGERLGVPRAPFIVNCQPQISHPKRKSFGSMAAPLLNVMNSLCASRPE